MTWLIAIGLTNAVLAGVLAVLAWGASRYARRPALARLMWVLVLCKLLSPPLFHPAVGHWFSVPEWLSRATAVSEPAARILPARDGSLIFHPARPGSLARSPRVTQTTPATSAGLHAPEKGGAWTTRLTPVSTTSWIHAAAMLWPSGSLVCIVWLAYRTWRFRRFLRQVARDDAALSERAARLAHDAGLSSSPRVLVVESAVSPMLWGAGRSACLLFPANLAARVDTAACDTLLLHELAHYVRGDWLVRVLELTAQVAYWWHPLVWYTLRQIEIAEEECCDAWVVEHRAGERRVYAEALLATLDFLSEPLVVLPPAACGLGGAGSLRSRLTQIMCGEVAPRPSRAAKLLVCIIAAVALPLGPSLAGTRLQEPAAHGTATQAGLFTHRREARRVSEGQGETRRVSEGRLGTSLANASGYHDTAQGGDSKIVAASEISAAAATPKPWFVPRNPTPRLMPVLYATAISPNSRYQLEARTGHRAALVDVVSNKRLDLSACRILAASFSPDSRLLATGQDDESAVRLWDAETGEVRALLKGSAAPITSVAFAPDASQVAAGASDGSVLIWNIGEEDDVVTRLRQDAPVSCLRWSRSGDRLAIVCSDWSNRDSSSLVVWQLGDAADVKQFAIDSPVGALDWLGDEELLLAEWSGAARELDLSSGMSLASFWLGKDLVSAAAFSPDCRLLPRWQGVGDGP